MGDSGGLYVMLHMAHAYRQAAGPPRGALAAASALGATRPERQTLRRPTRRRAAARAELRHAAHHLVARALPSELSVGEQCGHLDVAEPERMATQVRRAERWEATVRIGITRRHVHEQTRSEALKKVGLGGRHVGLIVRGRSDGLASTSDGRCLAHLSCQSRASAPDERVASVQAKDAAAGVAPDLGATEADPSHPADTSATGLLRHWAHLLRAPTTRLVGGLGGAVAVEQVARREIRPNTSSPIGLEV